MRYDNDTTHSKQMHSRSPLSMSYSGPLVYDKPRTTMVRSDPTGEGSLFSRYPKWEQPVPEG